ncbi:hypothetical protein [Roseinatronobacter sp. NSM]|uniref:hypothetical protein n=1 Tax=Roseinatronobacter sp. NSM TaxID=3457785 RepID=UPI004035A096
MGEIVHLRQHDTIAVDSHRIAALFRHLGAAQAEMAIITTLENLTGCLRVTEAAFRADTLAQVPEHARTARAFADSIGLVSLATILGQLENASQQQDKTAATALWHRAARVGDRSFVDLWQLPLLQM